MSRYEKGQSLADDVQLTYCGLNYWDRTLAIQQGAVSVPGLTLTYVGVDNPADLFRQQAQDAPYAVSEMSLSTFLLLRGRGDDRFVGLPIFPSRNFRHRDVYVSGASGIKAPADLRGRRVGVPEYQLTAALWTRAFLQHDYDVSPEELHWHVGGLREPAYKERVAHAVPPGVRIDRIPADRCLEGMLADGELDALVTVTPPPCLQTPGGCRRLFDDYVSVERAYHQRTGLFPIMHLVVCQREELGRHPGLARALYDLFVLAKAHGHQRLSYRSCLAVGLPWLSAQLDEIDAEFGGDAFPYGIEANRAVIEAAATYAHEQGLTPRRLAVEDCFAAELLQT